MSERATRSPSFCSRHVFLLFNHTDSITQREEKPAPARPPARSRPPHHALGLEKKSGIILCAHSASSRGTATCATSTPAGTAQLRERVGEGGGGGGGGSGSGGGRCGAGKRSAGAVLGVPKARRCRPPCGGGVAALGRGVRARPGRAGRRRRRRRGRRRGSAATHTARGATCVSVYLKTLNISLDSLGARRVLESLFDLGETVRGMISIYLAPLPVKQ